MFASRKSAASTLGFLAVAIGAFSGFQAGTALADTHWSTTLKTCVEDTHW